MRNADNDGVGRRETLVVAEALRAALRLPSQQPLHFDFLVTRVPLVAETFSSVARLLQPFGDSVAVLPHDSAIAQEERVLGRVREDDRHAAGMELFSATLSWIAKAFLGQ
jgi:hypothetical protein